MTGPEQLARLHAAVGPDLSDGVDHDDQVGLALALLAEAAALREQQEHQ